MVATPKTVLLQMGERKRRREDGRPESRSDTEDDMDELTLSYWIAFGDPADLAFSDRMHRFVTLDGSLSALHRTEAQARRDPLLE